MLVAILLTVLAGSATAIGGLIGVWGPHTSNRLLSAGVSLSAGVMIYISFVELLPGAFEHASSVGAATLGFFAGAVFVLVIEYFAGKWSPADRNRQVTSVEQHASHAPKPQVRDTAQLTRTALVMAVVLAAHNAPEGFVTLVSALQDPVLALPIVFAIAIHNIPEGIAVAVPMYHATGNRLKSWAISAASGMAEPIGALILYAILGPFLNLGVVGLVNAVIAGIMVFISLHELLPLALAAGRKTTVTLWLLVGMGVMAVSLLILG
ncbi:MAG: ZIP family metal transporter [Propionibacterium sp.]|nr:ZIP family metal transporter [Propionibacterium sp.]